MFRLDPPKTFNMGIYQEKHLQNLSSCEIILTSRLCFKRKFSCQQAVCSRTKFVVLLTRKQKTDSKEAFVVVTPLYQSAQVLIGLKLFYSKYEIIKIDKRTCYSRDRHIILLFVIQQHVQSTLCCSGAPSSIMVLQGVLSIVDMRHRRGNRWKNRSTPNGEHEPSILALFGIVEYFALRVELIWKRHQR